MQAQTEIATRPELRILIVDDNQDFIEGLVDVLHPQGYTLEHATNIKTAIEVNNTFKAQVTLIDLQLPDGSGTELIPILKEIDPDCLCIMVTGYAEMHSVITALEKGAYHYLQKPLNPEELLILLNRAFENVQLKHDKQLAEVALRRAQKMDAVGQMAGGIAHDFNNILNIILGNVYLLKREIPADDKILKRIGIIEESSERAAKLTRQLLGFSRREAGSVKATDINELINGMDKLITQSLTPQVEIEYHCAKNLWWTDLDSGDFNDALLNLVLNARDAMQGHGKLSIETSNCVPDETYCELNPEVKPGEYIQLTVSDNGSGIPAELMAHIFEPFFTTKGQGSGTGLGLPMVFGFTKRSKGHIKVNSESGIGTTFNLLLPRSIAVSIESKENIVTKDNLQGGTETILAVDDEPELLLLLQETLEMLGYKVLTAANAKQALQQLDKGSNIALLLSDVIMPGGINGYELAKQAVAKFPGLKVLLTSGYSEMAINNVDPSIASTKLLSKPYTQAELSSRIRERLNKK